MSKPTGTARPFIVFTAEDFALEVDGPFEITKAERQAVADRANAILNAKGTWVNGECYGNAEGEDAFYGWRRGRRIQDTHEALLFGPREIE